MFEETSATTSDVPRIFYAILPKSAMVHFFPFGLPSLFELASNSNVAVTQAL